MYVLHLGLPNSKIEKNDLILIMTPENKIKL